MSVVWGVHSSLSTASQLGLFRVNTVEAAPPLPAAPPLAVAPPEAPPAPDAAPPVPDCTPPLDALPPDDTAPPVPAPPEPCAPPAPVTVLSPPLPVTTPGSSAVEQPRGLKPNATRETADKTKRNFMPPQGKKRSS